MKARNSFVWRKNKNVAAERILRFKHRKKELLLFEEKIKRLLLKEFYQKSIESNDCFSMKTLK
jgi:hypothetical protein